MIAAAAQMDDRDRRCDSERREHFPVQRGRNRYTYSAVVLQASASRIDSYHRFGWEFLLPPAGLSGVPGNNSLLLL